MDVGSITRKDEASIQSYLTISPNAPLVNILAAQTLHISKSPIPFLPLYYCIMSQYSSVPNCSDHSAYFLLARNYFLFLYTTRYKHLQQKIQVRHFIIQKNQFVNQASKNLYTNSFVSFSILMFIQKSTIGILYYSKSSKTPLFNETMKFSI